MVEQAAFRTVFQFLQTVGILVGVFCCALYSECEMLL